MMAKREATLWMAGIGTVCSAIVPIAYSLDWAQHHNQFTYVKAIMIASSTLVVLAAAFEWGSLYEKKKSESVQS
jgi:hypothetical protein